MAPIYLMPLIEIHCFPRRADCPHLMRRYNEIVYTLATTGLIENKLPAPIPTSTFDGDVDMTEHGLVLTEKGKVFVKALQSVPMPVQAWRMPE
jgi:hypothetical protein